MTRKLDKEHLDEIQKLQTLFATNANTIGSISLEQIAINRRIEYLNSEQAIVAIISDSMLEINGS